MAPATKKAPAKKKAAKKGEPKLSDADLVKQSAAAPHASHAGSVHVLPVPGLEDSYVEVIDAARANVKIDIENATQADLHAVIKTLSQATQETY